ncbi:hypothetical protein AAKU55_003347 [Oxalobacteraceae bacterium GrIS 1.11]
MKNLILAASMLVLASTAMAADVGVSINVGQPGFYGRIDIGQFPRPQVIYAEPVIIERPVRYIERQAIYLRVPPGHAKHWAQHCRAYNACGQQVYFVQDGWYQNEYAPRYREQHGRDHDRDHGREHGRDHDRDEHEHEHERGEGHGEGREHHRD